MANHPNRIPFSGILATVDRPSDKCPTGSRGRRVCIPYRVAQDAIASLIGMAVDYSKLGKRHNPQRKVGIIDDASVRDGKIFVGGYLFGRDFPDAVAAVAAGDKGMSYEVTEVVVDLNQKILTPSSLIFTGAAILKRTSAAYGDSSIQLREEMQ